MFLEEKKLYCWLELIFLNQEANKAKALIKGTMLVSQ
jgi:hypothetical protein